MEKNSLVLTLSLVFLRMQVAWQRVAFQRGNTILRLIAIFYVKMYAFSGRNTSLIFKMWCELTFKVERMIKIWKEKSRK